MRKSTIRPEFKSLSYVPKVTRAYNFIKPISLAIKDIDHFLEKDIHEGLFKNDFLIEKSEALLTDLRRSLNRLDADIGMAFSKL